MTHFWGCDCSKQWICVNPGSTEIIVNSLCKYASISKFVHLSLSSRHARKTLPLEVSFWSEKRRNRVSSLEIGRSNLSQFVHIFDPQMGLGLWFGHKRLADFVTYGLTDSHTHTHTCISMALQRLVFVSLESPHPLSKYLSIEVMPIS